MKKKKSLETLKFLMPYDMIKLQQTSTNLYNHFSGQNLTLLKTPQRSPSFSRSYQKGDPIRFIDWKVFAKNDSLMIREEREQTDKKVAIMVDMNSSMFWPDKTTNHILKNATIQKIEIAFRVALNIGYKQLIAANKTTILLLQNNSYFFYEPKTTHDIMNLFQELLNKKFNITDNLFLFQKIKSLNKLFDFTYLVSDGLNKKLPLSNIKYFIHTLSYYEENISWLSQNEYVYFEEEKSKKYNSKKLKKNNLYINEIKKWKSQIEKNLNEKNIKYVSLNENSLIKYYLKSI